MRIAAVAVLAALAATACSASTTPPPAPSTGPTGGVDPANYVSQVTNPWFPLIPGQTRTYTGVKDDQAAHEVFVVTAETRTILGVTCVVVRDTLTLDGKPAERTDDWYAQDRAGNVWYFGEDTATLNPDGSVKDREGTFQAGIDGARAGIYMTARPQLGVDYKQESYPGHAEDHFVATDLSVPVTVPYRAFPSALRTKEYTPLEPDVVDHKWYVSGVGVVKEEAEDGSERLELTAFTRS
jgi:hypothetical protein